MTKIVFMVNAFDGELFKADAFSGSIGQTLNIRLVSGPVSGRLHDARVIDQGRRVQLTMEFDEPTARHMNLTLNPGVYSLGFTQGEGITAVPIPAVDAADEREQRMGYTDYTTMQGSDGARCFMLPEADRARVVQAADQPTAQLDMIERMAELPHGEGTIAGTYDAPETTPFDDPGWRELYGFERG